MNKLRIAFVALLFMAFTTTVFAQGTETNRNTASHAESPTNAAPSAHIYRLDFQIQEVDGKGKVVNVRRFSLTAMADDKESRRLKTGTRYPIATGTASPDDQGKAKNTQFQYVDLGVNLELHNVTEINGRLSFQFRAEVSNLASSEEENPLHVPVIRSFVTDNRALIYVDKLQTIYYSDALGSQNALQIAVTATLL